ncbi:MAG: hypothetical protein NUW37_19740 [Planctomycetes bacterium]|nr:hypothetical protein [Planctomycetota bacterium]
MATLRGSILIDSLQPQLTSFMASTAGGYLPITYDASYWIEIAPGIEINRLTDRALKATSVTPAVQVVERAYGVLEVHHENQGEVYAAREAILQEIGLDESERLAARVLTSELLTGITDYQAMLINRSKKGSMIVEGQTLYILECHPAVYAAYACNQAEKRAEITVLDVTPYGAFGRLQLAGSEASILEAKNAVEVALWELTGRENKEGEKHL